MRREFPARVKAQAFERAAGRCEGKDCGARLAVGKFEYDHDIACELGGDNSFENCVVLCWVCHKQKTGKRDMPLIAKGRRIRQTLKKIKKRSWFACSRQSKWKKKIDGTVVPR